MCWVAAIPYAVMAVGALASAQGAKQQASAEKSATEHNAVVEANKAQFNEYQARDALDRGKQSQFNQQLKTAQLKGAQRARFAAAGMDLNEGSAFNVLADTDFLGKLDEATISDNAEREAWMYRESARTGLDNSAFLSSRAAAISPSQAGNLSLLGSAGQVASTWYARRK